MWETYSQTGELRQHRPQMELISCTSAQYLSVCVFQLNSTPVNHVNLNMAKICFQSKLLSYLGFSVSYVINSWKSVLIALKMPQEKRLLKKKKKKEEKCCACSFLVLNTCLTLWLKFCNKMLHQLVCASGSMKQRGERHKPVVIEYQNPSGKMKGGHAIRQNQPPFPTGEHVQTERISA